MAANGHSVGSRSGSRRPVGSRSPVGGIRWDRVGRLALLFVFIGVAALYIGPSISYFQTRGESARRHHDISVLKKENADLKKRKAALSSSRAVENEARRQGMVKPGERAYVVKGLPDN